MKKQEKGSQKNNQQNSSNKRQSDFYDFDIEPPARPISQRGSQRSEYGSSSRPSPNRPVLDSRREGDSNRATKGNRSQQSPSADYRPRRVRQDDRQPRQSERPSRTQNSKNGAVQYRNKEEQRKAQYLRRKKRQKRNKIVGLVSLFLIMTIVALTLSLTVFFKISKIEIKNNQLYTSAQIEHMIDFKINDNMFMIGKKNQEASISSKLPYIKFAKISYKLPSTVIVTVTETTAKYSYKSGEVFYLLDEDLTVLEANVAQVPEGVAEIQEIAFKTTEVAKKVTFATEKTQKQMTTLTEALKKTNLDKITAVKPVNESTNFVVYDGRINVKLGSLTKLEYKLNLAKAGIDQQNKKAPDAKGTLDVTVDKQARFTAE